MSQPKPHSQEPASSSQCGAEPQELSPSQQKLSVIMREMNCDPTLMGIHNLGEDGILRSLDADRNVVDAVALTPELIKALLDRLPYNPESEKAFRGVDGTKAPKDQWYNPPPSMLLPPLAEEHRERDEAKLEENQQIYRKMREEQKNSNYKGCGVQLLSNNNLD